MATHGRLEGNGPWLERVRDGGHGLLIRVADVVETCIFLADGTLTCRHDHLVLVGIVEGLQVNVP
jgi:hypothetical protein